MDTSATRRLQLLLLGIASVLVLTSPQTPEAQGGCRVATNPVACENQKTGSDNWDVGGAGDPTIQGFATDISVNVGDRVDFKINTDATSYRIDIYRLGYYSGVGARLVATLAPSAALPQTQPRCLTDGDPWDPANPGTGLVDCGNWAVSASWQVPPDTVSGVFIAKLIRAATQGASHIVFIVRDDSRDADILFQTSDTTWQAYNLYGGASLYCGGPISNAGTVYFCPNRAVKVSYNRPIDTRNANAASFLFNAEYPMLRWLEANGYDVKYWSGIDSDRRGAELIGPAAPGVLLSVGHDEYWSGAQRAHVENARDAGVNLAFLSGNEVYWKTRYEASIDGSGTPYRTLVSYKETLGGLKIDPAVDPVTGVPIWTGTWRDTRFAPPLADARPENSLLGQIWTVNCCTYAITVAASMASLRIWQNTRVAELTTGTATLSDGTLGYEWGEVVENGFQPGGVIRLSSTTVDVPEKIDEFGSRVAPGTATHSLTLYRHGSGALVFAAGTVQWAWGLDPTHDRDPHPPDQAIQQATVTLLADMGAQPDTLQVGADPSRPLVTVAASNDVAPPVTAISSPAHGATVPSTEPLIVTGTATDTDGVVAGVEVSVDGGTTWWSAEGTTSWTYRITPNAVGPLTIYARAIDDSANAQTPPSEIGVVVAAPECPCTIWDPVTATPSVLNVVDSSAVELGVKFRTSVAGYITGVRFYKGNTNVGSHAGRLWSAQGQLLATASFTNETASGWQQVSFADPVAVAANTVFVASYHTSSGYSVTPAYFEKTGVDRSPLHALSNTASVNGVYRYGSGSFPDLTYNATNYWVDVVFETTLPADTTPPAVTTLTPAPNSVNVDPAAVVTATFSEVLDAATVSDATMILEDQSGNGIAAAVLYDSSTRTATLTPASRLQDSSAYTVRIRGGATDPRVKDTAGNALAADVLSTFTTRAPAACPCTIWDASTGVPQIVDSGDGNPVELGVKFRADIDGFITGIRFYKSAANTGTHLGNLWTADGTLLTSAIFVNETASGWQQVNFATPVAVTANTLYVASYHTSSGRYSINSGYFSTSADASPLHAVSNSTSANGVYRYGNSGFPSFTYNAANYWVDVVFTTGTAAPDTTRPIVSVVSPTDGAGAVSAATVVTATFNEPLNASTVSSETFELSANGQLIAAAVTYDATSRTTTLTPSTRLNDGTTYTARLRGGETAPRITDVAGNSLATDHVWTFTTAAAGTCPCSIWDSDLAVPGVIDSGDGNPVELGVKFRADVDGVITALRFYKSAANVGTHRANLWTESGTLLATATFTNETASGWQEVSFASPVPITGGTTYVGSYHTSSGRYSINANYFTSAVLTSPLEALSNSAGGNGVYRYGASGFPSFTYAAANYWVDVVYSPVASGPDVTAPTITAATPAGSATDVTPTASVTARFSESMDASSVTSLTFELRDQSSSLVNATVAYDAATRTATLTPTAALSESTVYTARVRGGPTEPVVRDIAGNALASDVVWSFTTSAPPSCPCTIWDAATTVPDIIDAGDPNPVELGLRFRPTVDGFITGLRFHKSAANTGPHTANLWTADGTLLATAVFSTETASGWQEVSFSVPVAVTANTVYVASYHTTTGRYSINSGYFATNGVSSPSLEALPAGASGNGVYRYGSTGFPTFTWEAANYWVDVVFIR